MKRVAIIADVILVGVIIFVIIRDIDRLDVAGFFFITLFLIAPILSIIALTRISGTCKSGSNLITLWFKRKTLEGKRKIEELSDK